MDSDAIPHRRIYRESSIGKTRVYVISIVRRHDDTLINDTERGSRMTYEEAYRGVVAESGNLLGQGGGRHHLVQEVGTRSSTFRTYRSGNGLWAVSSIPVITHWTCTWKRGGASRPP